MTMKTQLITLTMTVTLFIHAMPLLADDDDDSNPGVAPIDNSFYVKECGVCHFAYQPGLLPARSWQQLMANIENHFDENAELETDEQKTLTDYLVNNAADFSKHKRSRKIMRSLSQHKTLIRITEIPYIVHEHDELPSIMVIGNPKVKSLSYCDKCHTRADTGSYSEDDINIPGFGFWEENEHSSSFWNRAKRFIGYDDD